LQASIIVSNTNKVGRFFHDISQTFAFFFKLPKEEADGINIPMTRYENQWKEAVYFIEPGKTKIATFKPLFELAYKKLSGD